jgi:hypothetical protein
MRLLLDEGVAHQQNLTGLRIGVVIMVAPSNDIDDLRPLVRPYSRRSTTCSQGRSSEWVANIRMYPTRRMRAGARD